MASGHRAVQEARAAPPQRSYAATSTTAAPTTAPSPAPPLCDRTKAMTRSTKTAAQPVRACGKRSESRTLERGGQDAGKVSAEEGRLPEGPDDPASYPRPTESGRAPAVARSRRGREQRCPQLPPAAAFGLGRNSSGGPPRRRTGGCRRGASSRRTAACARTSRLSSARPPGGHTANRGSAHSAISRPGHMGNAGG